MIFFFVNDTAATEIYTLSLHDALPILHHIHYGGSFDVVAAYLRDHPDSRLFDGKGLILGGSHSPNYNIANSLVGDLSAILIENISPLANFVRVPRKQTALLSDFEIKRDRIAEECLRKNVTNLSGVPSWMLSVLVRVMELSGKQHLQEVWPNIEVFFHGGIAFTPYRKQYEKLITSPRMNYMETYRPGQTAPSASSESGREPGPCSSPPATKKARSTLRPPPTTSSTQ